VKTLFVLRHAKAETGGEGTQDIDRALTERGQNDARSLGELMAKESWNIDHALCSSSARTRQTASLMNAALATPIPITYRDSLYLAEAGDIQSELQQLDDTVSAALIIGHNPGLHQFCLQTAIHGDDHLMSDIALRFPTCAVATITLNIKHWADLGDRCGTLVDFIDRHMTGERLY